MPCRVNYLADRRAVTSTEIDGNGIAAVEQMIKRQHMRAGEIVDMNIVTHGCAIRRRIVCSKHRDIGSPTRSRIKDKRNEVGLRIVILADLGCGIGAGGVAVTQPSRFYSIGAAKVVHHALANEFAEAIGIDWVGPRMLSDWHTIRLAVDRTA